MLTFSQTTFSMRITKGGFMKKKILSFCLAFALIVPAIFLLSACGEPNRYYYTIKTPDNCTFYVNSVVTDKENKPLVNKGDEFEGQVEITPGYEVSGELILKVNGEVVDWTNTGENNYYYFSFIPTEDFDIVIEGKIIESSYEVKFMKGEGVDLSNLYIRFEGEEEQLVDDFLKTADAIQTFKYNDNLKFYYYTKGYIGEPSLHPQYAEFYKDEEKNEYGYLFNTTIEGSFDIELYGLIPVNIYFAKDASASTLVFSEIYTEQLKMSVSEDNLIITFGDDITQETISQLNLTINGEQQDVSLVKGENTIAIKPAYEYVSEDGLSYSPYHYTINLNFYDFAEFDGIFDEQ